MKNNENKNNYLARGAGICITQVETFFTPSLQGEKSKHGSAQESKVGAQDLVAAANRRDRRLRGAARPSGGGVGAAGRGSVVGGSGAGSKSNAAGGGAGSRQGRRGTLSAAAGTIAAVIVTAGSATLRGAGFRSRNLDAFVGAGRVGPGIGLGTIDSIRVVLDDDGLVVPIERTLIKVGLTTGPLTGAFVLGAAAAPGAELDLHGGLREGVGTSLARVLKSADCGAVDRPDEAFLGPVQGVRVKRVEGVIDVEVGATVICRGVAAGKVVGLDQVLLSIGANPLPVNLVEVIGLEDQASDDSSTLSSSHCHINLAKEHYEVLLARAGPR